MAIKLKGMLRIWNVAPGESQHDRSLFAMKGELQGQAGSKQRGLPEKVILAPKEEGRRGKS